MNSRPSSVRVQVVDRGEVNYSYFQSHSHLVTWDVHEAERSGEAHRQSQWLELFFCGCTCSTAATHRTKTSICTAAWGPDRKLQTHLNVSLLFFFPFFPLDPFCLLAFRPSTSLWLFNIWVMSERQVWEKVQNIYSELHLALYGQLRKRLCSGGKLACITNCTFFVKTHKSRRAVTVEVHMRRCR